MSRSISRLNLGSNFVSASLPLCSNMRSGLTPDGIGSKAA